MAQQANLKSLSIGGKQFSPSAEWTLGFGSKSVEVSLNLDGTTSEKEIPEADVAGGPIRVTSAKEVEDLVNQSNISLIGYCRNGDVYKNTGRVTNHVELGTDGGEVEIEFTGKGRFI